MGGSERGARGTRGAKRWWSGREAKNNGGEETKLMIAQGVFKSQKPALRTATHEAGCLLFSCVVVVVFNREEMGV